MQHIGYHSCQPLYKSDIPQNVKQRSLRQCRLKTVLSENPRKRKSDHQMFPQYIDSPKIAKIDKKDSTVVISKSKKRKIDFRFDTSDSEYSDQDICPKAKNRRLSVVKSSSNLPNIPVNNGNSIKNTRKRIPDKHIDTDDSDLYHHAELDTNPGENNKHSCKKLSGIVSKSSAPGRCLDETNDMENIKIAKLDKKKSTIVISKSKKRKNDFRFDTCDSDYSDQDIGPKAKIRRHSALKSSGTLPKISVDNGNSVKNTRKRKPDKYINMDDSDSYDEEEFNTNPGKKTRKHSNKKLSGVVSKFPAPGRDLDQMNIGNINQTHSNSHASDNTPPDGNHAQFVTNGVEYIYEETLRNVDIRKQSKECPLFTIQERTSKAKTKRNVIIQEHVNDAKPCPYLTTLFDGENEWKGSGISELDLLRNPQSNWGNKVYSSRKDNKFKRKCKGVYKCKSRTCQGIEKRKRKCRFCRSDMELIACKATIIYQLVNSDIKYIKHSGKHTCTNDTSVLNDEADSSSDAIVNKLPYDIDGDVVYTINTNDNDRWAAISDGRKWGRYISIKNSQGNNVYQRKCISRTACMSDDCPFYRRNGSYNTAQFENKNNEIKCRECGVQPQTTPCRAKKTIIVSPEHTEKIVVRHEGHHICTPVKSFEVCSQEIEQLTRLFPNVKPAVVSNSILKHAVMNNAKPEEMSEVARSLIDKTKVQKVKDSVKRGLFPHGTNVDAVVDLKNKMEESDHDNFLIYKIEKNSNMVFTTSKEKLKIACEMSGIGNEIWPTYSPYAHIDFQPSRVCGMSVLGVQCYHPNLKQTVPLFKLYAPNELAPVVEYGLTTFNEAVREFSHNACKEFNPGGWMADEAGAILKSLEIVYGHDIHSKLVTCQAHYKFSVERRKKTFKDSNSRSRYIELAYEMEKALTPNAYNESKSKMVVLINELNDKHLKHWLTWWDLRKRHWAFAFRPKNNAPLNNLSECIHASEKAKNLVQSQLIDAVHGDISSAYILKEKVKGYNSGAYTGGSGKSLIDMSKESESMQNVRSKVYSKDLQSSSRNDSAQFTVDPCSTHREDKVCDVKTGVISEIPLERKSKTSIPKITSDPKEIRPCKRRDIPSKLFQQCKENAILGYHNYTITIDPDLDKEAESDKKFLVLKKEFNETAEDYIVTISRLPECGCVFFIKHHGKQLCKHIIMVLLELGVPESDALLYQIGYTKSELESLLSRDLKPFQSTPGSVTKKLFFKRKHQFYLSRYMKLNRGGPRPRCCTCKMPIDDGLVIEIDGKYRIQTNSFDKTFLLHLKDSCLRTTPKYSDISRMPNCILRGNMSIENVERARRMTKYKIIWNYFLKSLFSSIN